MASEINAWDELSDPDYQFLVGLARAKLLDRFEHQVWDVGACEHPVLLRGETLTRAVDSGLVVARFSSDGTPFDVIMVRCMNRRGSRCKSCSRLYKGDTFQLVLAGLVGGKGVPEAVRSHPKVFATVTAPSFGLVHRVIDPDDRDDRCQKQKHAGRCVHGVARSCVVVHGKDDPVVGSPVCPDCYDYAGQVLWNAYAAKLWGSLIDTVYHRLAAGSGEVRAAVRSLVRVEYVRVAEYQARGVVHFHAVLRLDGPDDRADDPPAWATAELLAAAVESAAETVAITLPESAAVGERVLRFGTEKDAHPIGASAGLSEEKVAGYLAKYVSKSTEDAHGVDTVVTHASQIDLRVKNPHTRALMHMAWRLGGLAEFKGLRLRAWCHMLAFPGHNTTKSRRFSVTRTRLAQDRTAYKERRRHQGEEALPSEAVTKEAHWQFVHSGYLSAPMENFAADVGEQIELNRELARDALGEIRRENERYDWAGPDD